MRGYGVPIHAARFAPCSAVYAIRLRSAEKQDQSLLSKLMTDLTLRRKRLAWNRLQEQIAQERRRSFIDGVTDALSLLDGHTDQGTEGTASNGHDDGFSAHNDASTGHTSSSDSGYDSSFSDDGHTSDSGADCGGSDGGDGGGDGGDGGD